MKQLKDLTESEFNKLKQANLLNSIYPDAPKTFEQIKGKRPKVLAEAKFDKIIELCEAYLDSIEHPDEKRFKDGEHFIFEQALECVYGENEKSGVWDFLNSFDE